MITAFHTFYFQSKIHKFIELIESKHISGWYLHFLIKINESNLFHCRNDSKVLILFHHYSHKLYNSIIIWFISIFRSGFHFYDNERSQFLIFVISLFATSSKYCERNIHSIYLEETISTYYNCWLLSQNNTSRNDLH